jgi:hypothetical protein
MTQPHPPPLPLVAPLVPPSGLASISPASGTPLPLLLPLPELPPELPPELLDADASSTPPELEPLDPPLDPELLPELDPLLDPELLPDTQGPFGLVPASRSAPLGVPTPLGPSQPQPAVQRRLPQSGLRASLPPDVTS